MNRLFPLVTFDEIPLREANVALREWGHKMGALRRPMNGTLVTGGGDTAHGMTFNGKLVAVCTTSTLIRENVAGHPELTRAVTCELSRVCATRRDLCRVVLRLWRECVFPGLPYVFAVSYQDSALHTGDLYRFDGWQCIGKSHSGTDTRSGRKGRNKKIWIWPPLEGR